MISLTAKANFAEALKRLNQLKDKVAVMRKAMERSGEAIVVSTKMGYEKQKDPTGQAWAPILPSNPRYRYRPDRFGVVTPPNNPVTASSKALVNHGAMRTSLTFHYYAAQGKVKVGYGTKEQADKAYKHQHGIQGTMRISRNGKEYDVQMRPTARKNLGFSTWARYGTFGMDDNEIVVKIFSESIDEAIREVYG